MAMASVFKNNSFFTFIFVKNKPFFTRTKINSCSHKPRRGAWLLKQIIFKAFTQIFLINHLLP